MKGRGDFMKNQFSILIIEDEKNICDFMTKILTSHGYRVTAASCGRDGLSFISSCCPDVVLLDLGLPDMDGMEIIDKVRAWTGNPIIVISARTMEQDKVNALDAGADDYITKPFGTSELLARIRTSLRHCSRLNTGGDSCSRPYQALELMIDFEKHLVLLSGRQLHLTPVEYRIVTFLAQNSGRVLTYSAIMQNVWGPYIDSSNKILRVNMANIRRKLEKNPAEPQYIFTEIGVGYRMIEHGTGQNPLTG